MDSHQTSHIHFRIGMRNIKTALAVLVVLLAYHLTGSDGALLATIAAIICMQESVEQSVARGMSRMYGTTVGALQGMLFLYVARFFNNDYLIIVLIAFGVSLLILICNLLRHNDSIVIGCIVFLAIMLENTGQPPFSYSAYRLIDTFFGVVTSIVINRLIMNPSRQPEPSHASESAQTTEAGQTDTFPS